MKKILVVFAILSTTVLASCGGKGVSTEATDSTGVDSTEVVVDTTVVEGTEVVGGGADIVETEAPQGEAVK
jgi:ABC-type glycerol-3-phosphate transport system substrate-binding protein